MGAPDTNDITSNIHRANEDGILCETFTCEPPPPGSKDAYADQIRPPWSTSGELLWCEPPPPGVSDTYANLNQTEPPWPTSHEILHHLFPRELPLPGSTDAYANEAQPPWATDSEKFSREPPPPSFSDAYANFSQTEPHWPSRNIFVHGLLPHELPLPGSTDSYANETQSAHAFTFSGPSLSRILLDEASQPCLTNSQSHTSLGTIANVGTEQANNHSVHGSASASRLGAVLQPVYHFPHQGSSDPTTSSTTYENEQTQYSHVIEDASAPSLLYCSPSSFPSDRAGQEKHHGVLLHN